MTDDRELRATALKVDVDTRLALVWTTVWSSGILDDSDEGGRDIFAAVLRSAYVIGYNDALREDREGRRDELALANGYRASS